MERPSLLFITPVAPAPTGGGIEMRAHATLRALASHYRVHVLLTAPALRRLPPPPGLLQLCDAVARVPVRIWREPVPFARAAAKRLLGVPFRPSRSLPSEWQILSPGRIRSAAAEVGRAEFDVVHVFRLYAAPFLTPFSARLGAQLDLDDVESTTRRDLAVIARAAGRTAEAERWERDAAAYERVESSVLWQFRRLFVASSSDGRLLEQRGVIDRVETLPNVVTAVARPAAPPVGPPFTVLFVGSLGYPPNADALAFLSEAVIPAVRARASSEVVFEVVGSGIAASTMRRLRRCPELRLTGHVADVAPAYVRANAVVVPVRAGGGTRIKTLEAFAHGRPVVATSKGVEGLAVRSGEHVFVADSADGLAICLARLIESPALAASIAAAGHRFVREHHDPAVLAPILRPGG